MRMREEFERDFEGAGAIENRHFVRVSSCIIRDSGSMLATLIV